MLFSELFVSGWNLLKEKAYSIDLNTWLTLSLFLTWTPDLLCLFFFYSSQEFRILNGFLKPRNGNLEIYCLMNNLRFSLFCRFFIRGRCMGNSLFYQIQSITTTYPLATLSKLRLGFVILSSFFLPFFIL